ncbi:MAG: Gfo/Idh/MocA family protein [Anaerolineae bacterium]|jgi:scyllo-inositol 2-dehydrogenase (NADP+)
MADRKIRVGLIGLGRAGWGIHARTIQKPAVAEKFQVVAVTDPIAARMEEAKQVFGCRTYDSIEALLQDKDVEMAVVSTYNKDHPAHAIAAMKAGKHVLCEKPMATNVAEADEMIRVRDETKLVLTFNHCSRYASDFLVVQDVLRSGKLGEILLLKIYGGSFRRRWDWQTLKSFGGGEMLNNASHAVDVALALLETIGASTDLQVFADVRRTPLCFGDADDHIKIVMRSKAGGPMVDVELSNAASVRQEHYIIEGTTGGLWGNGNEVHWRYFNPKLLPQREVLAAPTPDRSYNSESIPWQEGIWQRSQDDSDGYEGIYFNMYDAITAGAPVTVAPELVRTQIAIFDEARRQSPV